MDNITSWREFFSTNTTFGNTTSISSEESLLNPEPIDQDLINFYNSIRERLWKICPPLILSVGITGNTLSCKPTTTKLSLIVC